MWLNLGIVSVGVILLIASFITFAVSAIGPNKPITPYLLLIGGIAAVVWGVYRAENSCKSS